MLIFSVDGLAGLKEAINEEEALENLRELENRWGDKYPSLIE